MDELFNPQPSSVSSSRIIYTPSTFARTSLLHLQEVGSLQAVHPHTSQREDLVSFLCFIVLSGKGELSYEGQTYKLSEGDCVFIDCRKAYSHSTSDDLWALQWCHFYAPSLPAVYEKYKERGGCPVFHPTDIKPFGCGAFRNPPAVVAQAMKTVVQEYRMRFETIEFAVYCPTQYDTNYRVFQQILGGM